MRQAAPGDSYQADIEPLLPATAGSFFHFQAEATPSTTAKLQHALNAKANQHNVKAAVQSLEERSRGGDKWDWAHHKAITARGAWGWKVVAAGGPSAASGGRGVRRSGAAELRATAVPRPHDGDTAGGVPAVYS